jgi:hypothetical protein
MEPTFSVKDTYSTIGGGAWRLARLEPHLNYELDIYSLEGLDLFYQTNVLSV